MLTKFRVHIKVCCIRSLQEANLALALGAYALGLVTEMPSGPGVSSEEEITHIIQNLPTETRTFLLTCRQNIPEIVAQQKRTHANTLQLVDALPKGSHAHLRELLPEVRLVQVIHVHDESSLDEALEVAPEVDALLLDPGNPHLAVKELGGTGRVHNWEISKKICAESPVPVFLAGGIRPENIREAIERVQPYGIDLCTGVRTEDRLDPEKLSRLFDAIRV